MESNKQSAWALIINDLIESELNHFIEYYRVPSIDRVQDLRALTIAWISTFFQEQIDSDNIGRIHTFVEKVMNESDYMSHGWYRIPALQATSFLLTRDDKHLEGLLSNLSCGQSSHRTLIMISTTFIVPLVSFHNETIRSSTMTNINNLQWYYEENIILRLSAKGTVDDKKRWLNSLKKNNKEQVVNFVNDLLEGSSAFRCVFFGQQFSKIKTYIIVKLLSQLSSGHITKVNDVKYEDLGIIMKFQDAENQHPLTGCSIDLSFLKEEPFGLFKSE